MKHFFMSKTNHRDIMNKDNLPMTHETSGYMGYTDGALKCFSKTKKQDNIMNKDIDLTEILKKVPIGTEFWSSVVGDCKLQRTEVILNYPIEISYRDCYGNKKMISLDNCGRIHQGIGECVLFPSEDQRDWSKFEIPEIFTKDEPVMCSVNERDWFLRYHTGKGEMVFSDGFKSDESKYKTNFPHIVKISKFDFVQGCKKDK